MKPFVIAASVLASACSNSSATGGVTAEFAAKVCSTLKRVADSVNGSAPEFVRANVVIAMADAFNTDPALLAQVSDHIDEIAIERCAMDRKTLLIATKLPSLQDVVR